MTVYIFIYRPEAKSWPKIVVIHPEDTIVFVTVEVYLASDLISPERWLIGPISVPFATAPGISQLHKVHCVTIAIKYLSHRE